MTVSYVFGLNEQALAVLGRDPALHETGCMLRAPIDIRRMLEAAPDLTPVTPPAWELFPEFPRFSQARILQDPDVLFDRVGSYGDVHCLPETDALGLRWAEIGMHLIRR
jgi:hypothetical protein